MDTGDLNGQMGLCTKESLSITDWKAKGFTGGLMEVHMKERSKTV